jgi:malate/lactate dehydrogenase
MFNFYKYKDKYFFSLEEYNNFHAISEEKAKFNSENLYFLNKKNPLKSRQNFLINHPSLLFNEEENIHLLLLDNEDYSKKVPNWIMDKINQNMVISINTNYPNWEDILKLESRNKWKLNLLALGDVGSTLAIGLRLLGEETIESIGIYDRNENQLQRWEYELNQIRRSFEEKALPPVYIVNEEKLFDCDMFIFCASRGIPPVGSQVKDVRMAQFNSNSEIIKEYAILAREKDFKGIFAVVSDPVDLLCKVIFLESNKDESGNFDFKGLTSNQIIGYGLGVMNGRASYYAEKSKETIHYLDEGRAFGPHGDGLIIADSIENYNEELSNYLTDKTINVNKEVRKLGYKPYVAPSLSSGALSIVSTIHGDWFYGSTYMGEAYIGSKCRLKNNQLEIEQLPLPDALFNKINNTYERLVSII